MQSYLTSKRLMTKLGMLRSGKKSKTLIVVEGVTDYRVYRKLFDLKYCEMIIGESKENVVEAVTLCEKAHLDGIIGIVDADFWHLKSDEKKNSKQLFVTDAHDLECMMLHSKAFDDVFIEYGDEGKRAKFERQTQEQLVNWMLKNVALIGCLRKLSLDKNLELRFSQLEFKRFIDMDRLEIQVDLLIQEILFHSRRHNQYSVKQIKEWMEEEWRTLYKINKNEQKNQVTTRKKQCTYTKKQEILEDEKTDTLWQMCCGHDLMEWLTIGFVNKFGDYNAKNLSSGQLEGCFRLTYHSQLFIQTELYKNLQLWETTQSRYRLFTTE